MPTSASTLLVAVRIRGVGADRGALRELLRHCLDREGAAPDAGLGLVLAGDRLVRRLNREWRGKDRTTDVLSFPSGSPPPLPAGAEETSSRQLGEMVISVPRCVEQAAERAVSPGVELVRLVVHGTLHLLGHDHEAPAQRARMEARERSLRAWAARRGIGPGLLEFSRSASSRRPASSGRRRGAVGPRQGGSR
jgi:probable rRNA maturation factor